MSGRATGWTAAPGRARLTVQVGSERNDANMPFELPSTTPITDF